MQKQTQTKSLKIGGKTITGKNFSEMRHQIKALDLAAEERNAWLSQAGQLFSKKDNGYAGKTPRNRHERRAQAKSDVSRKEMELDGIALEIFEGPMRQVLGHVRRRPRNVIFASVESRLSTKNVIIVAVKGEVGKITWGRIDKADLKAYFERDGYSMLSSMKAVGDARNGVIIHATGQNLRLPNVRSFVQAFARQAYRGTTLVGAKLNGEEVSTNVFVTPDGIEREAASWPASNLGAYAVVNIGSEPVTYLGESGYAAITAKGQLLVAGFTALIAGGVHRLFNKAAVIAKMPWTEIVGLELKKLDTVLDVAVSHRVEGKTDTFKVYVTGKGQIAILNVVFKNGTFALDGNVEYKPFNYDGMALFGRTNDRTVTLANRNGGPTALEFVPTSTFADIDPAFAAWSNTADAPASQPNA